jgi:hypothetical protein
MPVPEIFPGSPATGWDMTRTGKTTDSKTAAIPAAHALRRRLDDAFMVCPPPRQVKRQQASG